MVRFCEPAQSEKMDTTTTRIQLNDGNSIPLFGFGTYCLRDSLCEQAVLAALKAGYRSIDTATIYKNEAAVGTALRRSG